MRILPDNPSVDFLRQEAKDLLVALRESSPAASLADAQKVLADQYGFRTWADLKAEVEQRRNAPPAAAPALAEALAAAFDLGAVTGPMLPIAYEYMGRRWRLDTENGRWLVGPVFEWIDEVQAERSTTLRERARAAGVSAPRPVRDAGGRLVNRVDGQRWRVDEWMEFGPRPLQPVRATAAAKAGEILATLHGLAIPADGPINPFLTYRRSDAEWEQLLQRARTANKPWADDLANLLPTLADLRSIDAAARPSPLIVSNCDLIPEAVRLGHGDDLVVVHWEFAGAHVPEWELASSLMQWVVQPAINVPAARALADGYRAKARALPTLDVSSFCIGVGGWLNWTYNQMCEAIDPETPEKADFAERETRDLLADPLTRAKLEGVVAALEPVMG